MEPKIFKEFFAVEDIKKLPSLLNIPLNDVYLAKVKNNDRQYIFDTQVQAWVEFTTIIPTSF